MKRVPFKESMFHLTNALLHSVLIWADSCALTVKNFLFFFGVMSWLVIVNVFNRDSVVFDAADTKVMILDAEM